MKYLSVIVLMLITINLFAAEVCQLHYTTSTTFYTTCTNSDDDRRIYGGYFSPEMAKMQIIKKMLDIGYEIKAIDDEIYFTKR